MFQRLFNTTKWILCFVVVSSGPTWSPVNAAAVPTQNTPSTIEAQAKFFQDFFSVQLSPYKIEFGHVCEDPNNWEQRYEKKDFKNHRDMGKVRWGDKKGGYGEHYWDLNHAGHVGNHGNDDGYDSDGDDGSYHEDPQDTNNESNEKYQNYEIDEYNPDDNKNNYEESGRAKRAHGKIKSHQKGDDEQERLPKEKLQINDKEKREENVNEEEVTNRPFKIKPKRRLRQQHDTKVPQNKEKNNVVLVIKHKENDEQVEFPKSSEPKHFVPYEGGAGVRQPVPPELVTSASIPRLFLDQSTGYVIDRTTGQAFMLQPIPRNIHYS
ncbi:uncharacterized protein LOC126768346 [Nymphalis io]|uniref:uncharacterized protein LOC126768346 n=1 Tax=Inachis io TaxID=171585 RepID=UPI00216A1962|nr:uncharacterized protein LOC126768346 [Nymphalis io]